MSKFILYQKAFFRFNLHKIESASLPLAPPTFVLAAEIGDDPF